MARDVEEKPEPEFRCPRCGLALNPGGQAALNKTKGLRAEEGIRKQVVNLYRCQHCRKLFFLENGKLFDLYRFAFPWNPSDTLDPDDEEDIGWKKKE